MQHTNVRCSSRVATLAALALALVASGCKDTTAVGFEADVANIRLTITGQAPVTVNATGASGALTVTNGVATTIAGEFLDAGNGNAIAGHEGDFELSVVVPAGLTFTRTGPFTGTLTGTVDGAKTVQVGLWHVEEAHNDFGPFNVTVNVVTP